MTMSELMPRDYYNPVPIKRDTRKRLARIEFAKLFVDGEEISGHELGEAVRDLAEAERSAYRWSGTLVSASDSHNASSTDLSDGAAWSDITGADLLAGDR